MMWWIIVLSLWILGAAIVLLFVAGANRVPDVYAEDEGEDA